MRITATQIEKIKTAVARHFGEGAKVHLFGSRLDDNARGGDFDFYVEVEALSAEEIVEKKHAVLADLFRSREFFERKVDLVIRRRDSDYDAPIYHVATRDGVPL